MLIDEENESNRIALFSNVLVDLWYRNSEGKWKKKDDTSVRLNPDGELLLCRVAEGMWKIVGYKGIPIPACPRDIIKVAVHKDQPNLAFLYFWSHKGIKGRVMERTSNGQAIALSEAQAYLYKGDQQLSGPWESGSDGYFFVPPFVIDTILNQHGGGTYTVKVIPPARSMMRPVPQERTKNVDLTKCERLNPLDTCTRALTIDVGLFYFSYEPAFPGPGDGD